MAAPLSYQILGEQMHPHVTGDSGDGGGAETARMACAAGIVVQQQLMMGVRTAPEQSAPPGGS